MQHQGTSIFDSALLFLETSICFVLFRLFYLHLDVFVCFGVGSHSELYACYASTLPLAISPALVHNPYPNQSLSPGSVVKEEKKEFMDIRCATTPLLLQFDFLQKEKMVFRKQENDKYMKRRCSPQEVRNNQ